MKIDVPALLAPLDGGSPCGEDLEYDPDFVELQTLSVTQPERQVGNVIKPAVEPDYAEVARRAEALLRRAKDIRVAAILAEAVLRLDGPVPFAQVLAYVQGCVEQLWEHVHPRLDPDDDNDPTMRVNAMRNFSMVDKTESAVLRALRLAPLTESRALGRFSLRDILVAQGELPLPPGMEKAPDPATISAAFQDTDAARVAEIRAAILAARAAVKAIDAAFTERIGADGPDLQPLDRMLWRIAQALDSFLGAEAAAEATAAPAEAPGAAAPAGAAPAAAAPRAVAAPGTISGPDDVVRAIDRIIEYYERREPSSPIPLLMKRARRLVNADFTTIIKDMARGGFEQVRTVAGIRNDDDD